MKYVLMREEREVLEFDVDLPTEVVHDIVPLESAAWAPLGVLDHMEPSEPRLSEFISSRCISFAREDLPAILEATGARSAIELAFRSGGFSLHDPYWYRAKGSALTWEQDNFFDNDWDLSFGNAILRKDYEALGNASLATPDITCSGASRKAWLRDAQGPYLLKAPIGEGNATVTGEALTSRMLACLLPENEFMPYEIVERDGATYSSCRPMVQTGEELTSAWQVLAEVEDVPERKAQATSLLGLELLEEFGSALSRLGIEGSSQVVPKTMVVAHLAFNRDVHPKNLGVIRDRSGAMRLAPFFDFDRMFGLSHLDRMEWACARPRIAALLMANTFSNLDPSWDYSWYDKRSLDGFEQDIERTLSACEAAPEGYAKLIADLFVAQRTYLNRIAE